MIIDEDAFYKYNQTIYIHSTSMLYDTGLPCISLIWMGLQRYHRQGDYVIRNFSGSVGGLSALYCKAIGK